MVVLSTSILMLNNSKIIDNINNFNNNQKFVQNNVYIMFYITLLLMVTALPAVLVAIDCNKNNKFGILYMYHIWFSSNW